MVNPEVYNKVTTEANLAHEFYNSAYNHYYIVNKFNNTTAYDISFVPKENKSKCIVVGSGPSLDETVEQIKDTGLDVICSPSQIQTLNFYGVIPAYIVVLDSFHSWKQFEGIEWEKYPNTALVTHPGCAPDIIENWPNDLILFRQQMSDPKSFQMTGQKIMYSVRLEESRKGKFQSLIPTEIPAFGCVVSTEVMVATFLNYNKTYLTGCDFSYHSGKNRFTNYDPSTGEMIEHELEVTDKLIHIKDDIYTDGLQKFYAGNVVQAARLFSADVYTTDKKDVSCFPRIDFKEIDSHKKISPEKRKQLYEKFLAVGYSIYAIEADKGVSFVACHDPEKDLPPFMQELEKQGYKVDIPANLNRILKFTK